ncbi:MAG TPA: hypothetical protein VF020_16760, partial [Chthoniobacterales bacterium]
MRIPVKEFELFYPGKSFLGGARLQNVINCRPGSRSWLTRPNTEAAWPSRGWRVANSLGTLLWNHWVNGQANTNLYVAAESLDGSQTYAEAPLSVTKTGWQKLTFTLRPNQSDQNGRFSINLKSPGSLTLGYAFLEPGSWGQFKNLPVRADVANGLLNQGVRVLRYGGSMINA